MTLLITPAQTVHFCQFTQQVTFVAPKYRWLFLSPMFVVTSRHLSEITFLLCHHSILHFIIRTVTFCCLFISCLFCFNYSHPSWLMKDAKPQPRSQSLLSFPSAQNELSEWAAVKVYELIANYFEKERGHCFYNRNLIYCYNCKLAINYSTVCCWFQKLIPDLQMPFVVLFWSESPGWALIVGFSSSFQQLQTLLCHPLYSLFF